MARTPDQVLSFRHDLTDAVTGFQVTRRTRLVSLHQPDPYTSNGRLLRCLTSVARPLQRCRLVIDGLEFPPRAQRFDDIDYCQTYATFNRLLTAPTVYIEIAFPNIEGRPEVIVQFHFNDLSDTVHGIHDFTTHRKIGVTRSPEDEAAFTAGGVSIEGFSQPALRRSSTLMRLRSLLDDEARTKHVRLQFEQLLTVYSPFEVLLPYVAQNSIHRLSSLTSGEWSQLLPPRPERDLSELIFGPNPFPMVPYECHDTYSSIPEAIVELYESARIAHLEQEVALEEWASVAHNGTMYRVGGAIVMVVRFAPIRPLGGPFGVVKFDLPERLRVNMSWDDPMTGEALSASGSRTAIPLRLPIGYDALFLVNSKYNSEENERLRQACLGRNEADSRFAAQVKFTAAMPRGTLSNQLMTAMNFERAHGWHDVILNQRHDQLAKVDLATSRLGTAIATERNTAQQENVSTTPEAAEQSITVTVEQALEWVLNWRTWNAEQLQALNSIRQAVGRVILITGPAGTGKTLLLQAICVFFYLMDLHVLVLAPANSNCADFMRKLVQYFPRDSAICGKQVLATRVFPPSADFSPEKEAYTHNATSRPFTENTNGSAADATLRIPASSLPEPSPSVESGFADIFDLEMVRSELQSNSDKYSQFKDFGVAQQVLTAAREGTETLVEQLGRGEPVDVWQVLRECIKDAQAGNFDWNNKAAVQKYQQSYNACKAHFLSKQRLVVTTTGNVRCEDIVNNFASNKHGVECKGIIVVLDEACKDREIDSLSAVLHPDWRAKITGMIMLGDERQLEPTNTCAKGRVQFNPFSERLNIPLLSRLKREGFPCVELVEQHRMSHHISAWPSKNFYGNGMRDGDGTKGLLAEKRPGLFACLKNILTGTGSSSFETATNEAEQDKCIRTHYLELHGKRDNSKRSAFVQEHVHVFFDRIYWKLLAYYGERMEDQVMIIVAYKGAKEIWNEAVAHLQRKYNIPHAQMPRILTIDSSQGTEAPITIIDCSVQEYSSKSRRQDIGFVDDDRRMNVAMTRAQEVRWFLGGSCSVSTRAPGQADTPAYVRFKEESAAKEVTMVDNCLLRRNDLGWLKSLRKQEVQLELRFSDEVKVEV